MKKAAVFNDISGFGKCSLTAALPIISALGVQCCPIPTAVLSNQTGYPSYHCHDLTQQIGAYLAEWKKLGVQFDAILTGFITGEEQNQTFPYSKQAIRNWQSSPIPNFELQIPSLYYLRPTLLIQK